MRRRQALFCIGLTVIGPRFTYAQRATSLPHIVVLHVGTSNEPASLQREPFEHTLRQYGWVPGSTVRVEYRYAEGDASRLSVLAREIVQSNPSVIVARGPAVVRAISAVTKSVPVVMLASGDPVAEGFVKSLARPGTNMTGVFGDNFTLDAKRLELLKEAFPRVTRTAILTNPHFDGDRFDQRIDVILARARRLKLQPQVFRATRGAEIAEAFAAIANFNAEALLVRPDPELIDRSRSEIITLAAKHRLPAVYPWRFFVDAGGLMSYNIHFNWLHAQSAVYVSRILKGEKPAEMPLEQSAKYDLAVNLGAARALGVEIPQSVLFRADHIIN
jgi:putative ABC transport system substrate-binding protein